MEQNGKRKAEDAHGSAEKRTKTKKQWQVPRKNDRGGAPSQVRQIQAGDSGIWVTCNRGKEGKCIGEMRDLFAEYAERLYPQATETQEPSKGGAKREDEDGGVDAEPDIKDEGEDAEVDIEQAIKAEVNDIRKPAGGQLFTPCRIDVQCVIFFKTMSPVEPVSLVKTICEEAMQNSERKRTRHAKRLSPMTLMGRASTEGLDKVAQEVLAPHFHQEPFQKRKFAIRPTLRNHNVLTRDSIIKQVAAIVGPGHQVDLKNYELLIVVEVYQNILGLSVIDDSFERLKRFNIAEIFDPTPKEDATN